MLIDIHTHKNNELEKYISIFSVDVRNSIDNKIKKYSSVGIHPWYINDISDISIVEEYINLKNIIAIGEVGLDKLVGTDYEIIVKEAQELLDNKDTYETMSKAHNPYGDGKACEKIVNFFM